MLNHRIYSNVLFLVVFMSVCMVSSAFGVTYYVNKLGSNGNACSAATNPADANAKLTISGSTGGMSCIRAASSAVARTLIIGDGTYNEELNLSEWVTGSLAAPITIKAENQLQAILKFIGDPTNSAVFHIPNSMSYITIQDFFFDGTAITGSDGSLIHMGANSATTGTGAHHITIAGNEFDFGGFNETCVSYGRGGVPANYPHDNIVEDNIIHDCGSNANNLAHGVYPHGADNIIRNNTIYNIGGTSPDALGGWCIHVFQSTYANDRNEVYGNTCYNSSNGILLGGGDDLVVYNNLVYGVFRDGINLFLSVGNQDDNLIYNNTIFNTARHGILIQDSGYVGTQIKNNIIWDTGSTSILDSGVNTSISNNICTNGCGSGSDPLFINEVTKDFNLQPGSPAIGIGIDFSSLFTLDLNGDTRTVPWDIGAYEFNGAPPVTDLTLSIINGGVHATAALTWPFANEIGVTEYCVWVRYAGDAVPGLRLQCIPKVDLDIKKDGTGFFNFIQNYPLVLKAATNVCFRVADFTDSLQVYGTEACYDHP